MKKFLVAALVLLFTVSVFSEGKSESAGSGSADWPKQNITIIGTHGAGGDTDYNGRLISRFVEKNLGVSLVPTNVTGSNGNIAMEQYRNAKPDGYTFIMTNTTAVMGNEATGLSTFGWDAFEPVAIYGRQSGENIIVPASSPYQSIDDLVKASKAKPNTVRFGISTGGGVYIASVILAQSGAEFAVMDQGDGASRMTALLGDHVDATIVPYATAKQYVESGQIRALATLLSQPPSMLKHIPSASKTGVPDLVMDTMYVCLAPKGTPREIVEKMNAAILDVVNNDPEYAEECRRFNLQDPWALSVDDTIAELKKQREHFMKFSKYLR